MSAYRTAARLFPGCHLPTLYIGMEYMRTHSFKLAEQFFVQAKTVCCPSDPLVYNELGVVAYHMKEYQKAVFWFEKTLSHIPSSLNEMWEPTVVNLAHAYRKLNVAIMKLAEMEYCGTTSYFIKLLFEKKYALPYRVLDAAAKHFMKFVDDPRTMPVIWHQSLLAFVLRYKNELTKEDKDDLRKLVVEQKHRLVTPEICRELVSSRNRGEKEDDLMSIASPSAINKTIEEDRFDIPEVPMEKD